MESKGGGRSYEDQRKIYKDSTRSLSIDHPNLLNFPICRMDLLFWHNIHQQGENIELIRDNFKLSDMNIVYENYSLFHYFAENSELIEMVHEKFKKLQVDSALKECELNTPLTLLHPDPQGMTALDVALKLQRPKSFLLMLDMLIGYDNLMLSKMMLSVIPYMIN